MLRVFHLQSARDFWGMIFILSPSVHFHLSDLSLSSSFHLSPFFPLFHLNSFPPPTSTKNTSTNSTNNEAFLPIFGEVEKATVGLVGYTSSSVEMNPCSTLGAGLSTSKMRFLFYIHGPLPSARKPFFQTRLEPFTYTILVAWHS